MFRQKSERVSEKEKLYAECKLVNTGSQKCSDKKCKEKNLKNLQKRKRNIFASY